MVSKKLKKKMAERKQIAADMAKRGYKLTGDGGLEHRAVWKEHHGKIPPGWVIHHINEVRDDNDISNLVALPVVVHDRLHQIQRAEKIRFTKEQLTAVAAQAAAQSAEYTKQVAEYEYRLAKAKAGQAGAGLFELLQAAPAAEKNVYPPLARRS